jgi:MoaA/NifB/PqqE/SkfB family radical SAM enzyme
MDVHYSMSIQSLYETLNRYRSLKTDRISSLPIVILMPHSACNCRCVMCDIWKGNHNLKQLTEADITGLLESFEKFGTQQVLMSGGEALLNQNFFRFCEILKKRKVKITLLSTGLTLKKHAQQLVEWVDDIIVSLDGDEQVHDCIRNIPGAFSKLREGIQMIRSIQPGYPISARTVIHRLNYKMWPRIIDSAKQIAVDRISFLPADVSSSAFNREILWGEERQHEILLSKDDLDIMEVMIDDIILKYAVDFSSHFISESPQKLKKIYYYYAAHYGLNEFPYKKCNAPWVSTVIEADGSVRPCFFHDAYGNVKSQPLDKIINSDSAISFRKNLDMDKNETCVKCVCYLNLSPLTNLS